MFSRVFVLLCYEIFWPLIILLYIPLINPVIGYNLCLLSGVQAGVLNLSIIGCDGFTENEVDRNYKFLNVYFQG